jgi:hypothetical protein
MRARLVLDRLSARSREKCFRWLPTILRDRGTWVFWKGAKAVVVGLLLMRCLVAHLGRSTVVKLRRRFLKSHCGFP